jgi:hypothetical protein
MERGGGARAAAVGPEAAPEGRLALVKDIGRFLPWKCLWQAAPTKARTLISHLY